jgi:uncharacterized membrane protein YkvA (DUF1232 family)
LIESVGAREVLTGKGVMSHKEEFIGFLSRSITEISLDVKIMFAMMDDPEFAEETRARVAGALLYLLAPGDLIPDTFGLLGQSDDCLVMRMTMAFVLRKRPERAEHYHERYPEVFETLQEDLEIASNYLGEIYPWMEAYLDKLITIEFKGKKAQDVIEDVEASTWLHDEINEALLDLEFDDDELNREMRRVDRILPVMEEKMNASRR